MAHEVVLASPEKSKYLIGLSPVGSVLGFT